MQKNQTIFFVLGQFYNRATRLVFIVLLGCYPSVGVAQLNGTGANEVLGSSALNFVWMIGIFFAGVIGGLLVVYFVIKRNSLLRYKLQALSAQVSDAKRDVQKCVDLFNLMKICIVVWEHPDAAPLVYGDRDLLGGQQKKDTPLLALDRWLLPHAQQQLQQKLDGLLYHADAFDITVETCEKKLLSVSGFINAGCALVKFQDSSTLEIECAEQKKRAALLATDVNSFYCLLDAIPEPSWIRRHDGCIRWANAAYQQAVSSQTAGDNGKIAELFSKPTQDRLMQSDATKVLEAATNIDGNRHYFKLSQVRTQQESVGFAFDITQQYAMEEELQRVHHGHSETLDLLSTAVAIFDSDMKLKFFNQAFSSLWPLDVAFLSSQPSHTLVLDRLREKGLVAEQPDWRGWKENLLAAYRHFETIQHIWNLPDGRTLRILAHPHPQGGVIWLHEDLTETLHLKTRYNTLIKMQGETLDHLSEGVVVFAADGRIRLSNPAFIQLWSLPPELAIENTHINAVEAHCRPLVVNEGWNNLASLVTGFAEQRESIRQRMDLVNGTVLDFFLVPLPNGQTMFTFVDVTANVHYARALREKNDALQAIDQLRSDFVQHVSYELRTPLTNIIGFTDLMKTPELGGLRQQQYDYLDHIGSESAKLLSIVNDILDLATVDAGIMELELGKVCVTTIVDAAIERFQDRLVANNVRIDTHIASDLPDFYADSGRVRQVLNHLLSNATNFAPYGSVIQLAVYNDAHSIVLSLHDDGKGIPDDIVEKVFKRFSSHAHHGARAGAGLGLAIVKSFVELHGGDVSLDTSADKGTTLVCRFPIKPHKQNHEHAVWMNSVNDKNFMESHSNNHQVKA